MVKLILNTEEAQLLASVIDGAQFTVSVSQSNEFFAAIQQLKDIKARLLEPQTQAEAEK
jgi:hypothetical protein